jgi:hypothetical protein
MSSVHVDNNVVLGQFLNSKVMHRLKGPAAIKGESSTVTVSWLIGSAVTSNVHSDDSLQLFVAVHVTVVVPLANVDPLGGVQITIGVGSQSSVANGVV